MKLSAFKLNEAIQMDTGPLKVNLYEKQDSFSLILDKKYSLTVIHIIAN